MCKLRWCGERRLFSLGCKKMAKKKFIGKYETILDHNPTPQEFEEITGFTWHDRFEFLAIANSGTPHSDWSSIEQLYSIRGDDETAKEYSKIPEWEIEATYFDLSL